MYFAGSFIIKYMRCQCDQVLTTVFFLPMFRGYCATWISGNAPPSPKSYKKVLIKWVFFLLNEPPRSVGSILFVDRKEEVPCECWAELTRGKIK